MIFLDIILKILFIQKLWKKINIFVDLFLYNIFILCLININVFFFRFFLELKNYFFILFII